MLNFNQSMRLNKIVNDSLKSLIKTTCRQNKLGCRRRRLERHPLQVRHRQDWGRGFILLLAQAAVLPGSDAGSDDVKPASSFVIQNRQTSCSSSPRQTVDPMWCPIHRARH